MEAIQELANIKLPLLGSIIVTILGMFIFNFGEVCYGMKLKKFSDFKIAIWWEKNQISFVFSFIISWIIFGVSWHAKTLTAEHCFLLGFTGHLILSKLIKFFYNKPASGD